MYKLVIEARLRADASENIDLFHPPNFPGKKTECHGRLSGLTEVSQLFQVVQCVSNHLEAESVFTVYDRAEIRSPDFESSALSIVLYIKAYSSKAI